VKYKKKKLKQPSDIPYKPIILIFIGTFLVRLLFILTMKHNAYSIISRYTVDSIYYHEWALNLAQGNWIGHEVFFLGPFYAYFLGIIYAIFGNSIFVVQIIQSILASFSCVLLYLITRKISNHHNGVVASVIYILSGILVFYTGVLLYVEVNIFLSLLLAYILLKHSENFSIRLSVLAGIVLGLLVIVRPEFLLLLLILIPYFIFKVKEKPMFRYFVFFFFTIVVVSVIPIRNYLVGKDFVPFTAHSGVNFYYGNNPQTDGTWRPAYPLQQTPDISIAQLQYSSQRIDGKLVNPSVASNYWFRKGLDFIKENPLRYIKLLGRKFLLFINGYEIPNNYYFYQTRADSIILKTCFISFGLIFPFAVAGIILSTKQWKDYYLIYSFIFVYLVSSLVFYVISRLRAPVIPFLIIFAAVLLNERFKGKIKQVLLLIVTAVIILGLGQLKLINKNEFNTQGYIQQGNIYQSVRMNDVAAESYNRALELDPQNIIARYSLLQTYISLNRPSQAAEQLQSINEIAQNNSHYQVYAHLAKARFDIAQRNFSEAANEFQQALILNPYDAETHYLLGAVYITLGNYQKALVELQKTLELDPNHQDARNAVNLIKNRFNLQ
jgi:tetratricopeptide (TPR) repeat protein